MARPSGHGEEYASRRTEVIRIAAEIFARQGYAATGVAELCEATQLGRGALYYYIGSKENLLIEIQSSVMQPLIAATRFISESPESGAARLRALSQVLLTAIFTQNDSIWVYQHEHRSLSGAEREALLAQRATFEDLVHQLIDAAIEDRQIDVADSKLATFEFLNLHNYTYQWVKPDGPWTAEFLSARYMGTLLRGWAGPALDLDAIEAEAVPLIAAVGDLPPVELGLASASASVSI